MKSVIVRKGRVLKNSINKEWHDLRDLITLNDWVNVDGHWFYKHHYELTLVQNPPDRLKLLTMIME